jgi:hypothetical protein
MVERRAAAPGSGRTEESEVSPGSLYSSGLIAAGGVMGLLGMGIKILEKAHVLKEGAFAWGANFPLLHESNWLAVITFGVLAFSLYHFARKPLDSSEASK